MMTGLTQSGSCVKKSWVAGVEPRCATWVVRLSIWPGAASTQNLRLLAPHAVEKRVRWAGNPFEWVERGRRVSLMCVSRLCKRRSDAASSRINADGALPCPGP